MKHFNQPIKILLNFFFFVILGFVSQAQDVKNCDNYEIIAHSNVSNIELLNEWESFEIPFSVGTVSNDGDLMAVAFDNSFVQLLSMRDFTTLETFSVGDTFADFIMFDETGHYLVVSSDMRRKYQIWDIKTNMLVQEFIFKDAVWSSIDNRLQNITTLDNNGDLTSYNPLTGKKIFTATNIQSPSLSSNGELIIFMNSENLIELWNIPLAERLLTIEKTTQVGSISGYGFNIERNLFWISWDDWNIGQTELFSSIIEFRNLQTGELEFTLGKNGNIYKRITFNSSGSIAAITGTRSGLADFIWLTDLQQDEMFGIEIPTPGGGSATFNADSDVVLVTSGTDSTGYIYDPVTFTVLATIDVGSGSPNNPIFSADGRFLLTQGQYVRLWDIPAEMNC